MPVESPSWTTLVGMGVTIAAMVAVGLGLGLLVDSLTGAAPVFLLIGLLIGIVGAIGFTVAQFRKYLRS
ncbi:AtpZ/AtpI family protein [Jatrophihabitans endophyticus]|uniref:AtpZ/AtpI family protein n=1 Tax=Jatrophihabitans endophyticus TaxID=1206085 RepID=UPI001A106432|nr:AtpZ/AtpI family protein [Jatrophihabitans endophyticus]MBE7188868.1 AtpZ/AtpI family protein [Jatrophihabitans endophyticus]